MTINQSRSRRGFTLVEIMIVVAIIALLAAIAVPNFMRARKRSQATHILNDLRIHDAAVDQYCIETDKKSTDSFRWEDVRPYIKTGSRLYNSNLSDELGNHFYTIFTPDAGWRHGISQTTF